MIMGIWDTVAVSVNDAIGQMIGELAVAAVDELIWPILRGI